MRTPFAKAGLGFCHWRRPSLPISRIVRRAPDVRAESGLSLIEVLIASVIVAVIAVGTLTGVIAAGKSTADTRSHAQATVLAAQDEERLRGLSTAALGVLGSVKTSRAENGSCVEAISGGWHYWSQGSTAFCENPTGLSGTAYTGTVYTITSTASYVTGETGGTKANLTCETTGGTANYIQTTSTVTWSSLGTRTPVTQSTVVTVPTSDTLLVKVLNQRAEPVEGATVTVSGISPEVQETTPSSGCVVFGGLSSTSVKVAATKLGWVNRNAEAAPAAKALTLSKTATTDETFYLGEPGNIQVKFVEAGTKAAATGSTFYAFQTGIATPDGFVGGSTSYASTASLPSQIAFPFRNTGETPAGESPYTVFAGDCEANNPRTVTGASTEINPKAQVEPNAMTKLIEVEEPKVTVTVDEGTSGSTPLSSAEHAMITNSKCSTAIARTSTGTASVPYKHEVTINSAGHLVQEWQPYGEFELCVVQKKATPTPAKYYKYKTTFTNKVATGTVVPTIYMQATGTGHETPTTTAQTCP
jgi:prepilin-type N-terminal cleavage/methylation domain-containing protein